MKQLKMRRVLLIITGFVVLVSCGGSGKKQQQPAELTIEIPSPPSVMTEPDKMALYMAGHYWDNMDFADTLYIGQEVTEQAFASYLYLLGAVPPQAAAESVGRMMDDAKADSTMYAYFAELAEKYLYDPNSPYRNEELYIAVLQNIVAWDKIDELYKLRPQSQLDMAMKNRVGERAADFRITLSTGATRGLHDIKADYTLLYFNNPDCPACAQLTSDLTNSQIVEHLRRSGELQVVTVYPDEDLTAWRAHLADLPIDWINGYDGAGVLRGNDLYDLRAIPTLYLLDSQKYVLLKDAVTAGEIDEYFRRNL